MLKIIDLKKSFNGKKILDNISMNINRKEVVSILGKSGCGKSTLLNIIGGFLSPDSGDVLKNGKSILLNKRGTAYMFQDDLLLENLNIFENVVLPLKIQKKNIDKENILKLMEKFGIVEYSNNYPEELSGGMRQRVALLRTYLSNRDLYLFDEPFSKLDNITRKELRRWFLKIWKDIEATAIFITHDIDEAIELSNRIYIVSDKPSKIIREIVVDNEAKIEFSDKNILLKKEIMGLYIMKG